MNKKIFLIVSIIVAVTIIPITNAQLIIGNEANQESVEIKLNQSKIANVKHVVNNSNSPVTLNLFKGEISNLTVKNEEGNDMLGSGERVGIINDGLGNESILIFPSNQNSIVEYDLADVTTLYDNIWTGRVAYSETYSVLFSEDVEMIFLNNNLIQLGNNKGLSINEGGEIVLQYYDNIPKTVEQIQWEEDFFDVELISNTEIENFSFEQESKSISFEINEINEFVTITMSEKLLGGPYLILLDDEKIKYNKYIQQENYISLSMKPESIGQITIIGTTVIPEFSMFIPMIMGFLVVLTVPFMKKFSLH